MRAIIFLAFLCMMHVECQFWTYPQKFLTSLFRQGKTESEKVKISSSDIFTPVTEYVRGTTRQFLDTTVLSGSTIDVESTFDNETSEEISDPTESQTRPGLSTAASFTPKETTRNIAFTSTKSSGTTEFSTTIEATTFQVNGTNEERKNHQKHEMFLSKREKPHIKVASNISQNLLPLPANAGAALVKPTKYHYYPHNQHIYLLPECAIQQVCNAVYIRLNWTQPLCACPSRYRDPCSASLNGDDLHTTELMMDRKSRRALTLVKTCEPIAEMRICHAPRDWSLLALQNIRTGKSHYLVICRCPETSVLEGPMSHDQPTYASVPGIRVYGMMCVDAKKKRSSRRTDDMEAVLMAKAIEFAKTVSWI